MWRGQADKLSLLLPEGLKEISLHGCVKLYRQHVLLQDRCSQVSLAVNRWPTVQLCAARACIIMYLRAMSEKHLTLGKPSAGADLHCSSSA